MIVVVNCMSMSNDTSHEQSGLLQNPGEWNSKNEDWHPCCIMFFSANVLMGWYELTHIPKIWRFKPLSPWSPLASVHVTDIFPNVRRCGSECTGCTNKGPLLPQLKSWCTETCLVKPICSLQMYTSSTWFVLFIPRFLEWYFSHQYQYHILVRWGRSKWSWYPHTKVVKLSPGVPGLWAHFRREPDILPVIDVCGSVWSYDLQPTAISSIKEWWEHQSKQPLLRLQ